MVADKELNAHDAVLALITADGGTAVGCYSAERDDSGTIRGFRIEGERAVGRAGRALLGEGRIHALAADGHPAHTSSPFFPAFCELVATGTPLIRSGISVATADPSVPALQFDLRAVRHADGFIAVWRVIGASVGSPPRPALDRDEQRAADEQQQLLRLITDNMLDIVALGDLEGRYTYVSPSIRQLGYQPRDLVGRPMLEHVHPDDRAIPLCLIASLNETHARGAQPDAQETHMFEYRYRRADGRYVDLESVGQALADDHGVSRGFIVGTRDASERKRAVERLRESERRFRALFENNLAPIVITSADGRCLDANSAACELLGYERGVLLSMNASEIPTAFRSSPEGDATRGEMSFTRSDGSERTALFATSSISEGERACVLQDVTALHASRLRLKQETERLQNLLDVAAVMLLGLDADLRITLANQRVYETLGVDPHQSLLGRDWIQFVPAAERRHVREMHEAIVAGQIDRYRRIEGNVLAGDSLRNIVWHNAVIRDPDGRIRGTLSSGEDVTEHREMAAQLAQADRLSNLGMLAAGVAHEINNPLTYVLNSLQSLSSDLPALFQLLGQVRAQTASPSGVELGGLDAAERWLHPAFLEEVAARFGDALRGTRRIQEISRGLGTFSRVERDEVVPVDLRQVIDAALRMAEHEIKYRAQLVSDFAEVPPVLASEGRLSQVFLNLLVNATHAVDEGALADNRIGVRTWADSRNVYAEVWDTGSGIPAENMSRLFEPFFTTKKIGLGSGLGLPISKSIIEGYGGSIHATSELGKGSRFTVRLPHIQSWSASAVDSPEPALDRTPAGRVLIVDDDDSVRRALSRMLRAHECVQAPSGAKAKELLVDDQSFDVILCDVMMSDLSGIELHQWLAETRPELAARLVFISGGAFTPRARDYLAGVQNKQLHKPFDLKTLQSTVDDFVARSGRRQIGSKA